MDVQFHMGRVPWCAAAVAALVAGTAAACRDLGPHGGQAGGSTRVLLTDDPFPYDRLSRVDLYVVSVSASLTADTGGIGGDTTGSNFITIARPERRFNILALQGETTAELGSVNMPAGAYKAVRMVIATDSSSITLKDGRILTGTSKPGIQWQSSTGRPVLKALVAEQLAVPDTGAVIVIDFDAASSFLPVQVMDPGSTDSSFIFTPFLHAVDAARTGSVSGTVRALTTAGAPIADASVQLYLGNSGTPENTWQRLSSGKSDATGAFKLSYVTRSAWWAQTAWGPMTYVVAVDPPHGAGLGRTMMPNVTVNARQDVALGVLVLPQGAARLAFVAQPSTVAAGMPISPAVWVAAQDSLGHADPTYVGFIALTITGGTGTAGATLSGTRVQQAAYGMAAFADLSLDRAGTGYRLTASAGGLASATSSAFTVTAAPVPAAVFVAPATATLAVLGASLQLTAEARDGFGRVILSQVFTWSSSDSTKVIVSSNGLVTAVAAGSAVVGATTQGVSGRASITVAPARGGAAALDIGIHHTCAVTTGSQAYCWGWNQYGQLGDGTTFDRATLVPVTGAIAFQRLTASYDHTCGLTAAGAAYCWGNNYSGQLGDGSTAGHPWPAPVPGGFVFRSLTAGWAYTCGVTTSGVAYCWGDNSYGQLGTGSWGGTATVPVEVAGGLAFQSVEAGIEHVCGVTTAGAAYCWGSNAGGQLGVGASTGPEACIFGTSCSTVPAAVAGGLTFAGVSAGSMSCGVTTGRAAYCWGYNSMGELGNGSNTPSNRPVPVSGDLSFTQVDVGGGYACGVATNGAGYCWGNNSGAQLGDGTRTNRATPTAVGGGLTFASIRVAESHGCGLTTAATVYCWGANSYGKLGDGTTTDRLLPVQVLGLRP
jgi:alpha-tubulin suppressor-like RCC1 family protein